MKYLLHKRAPYIVVAVVLIVIALLLLINVARNQGPELVTATVTRGDIVDLVSVSGVIEADNTAELAFPVSGIVSEVLVREGDEVREGDVLAQLEQAELQAQRSDAYGAYLIAAANRDELLYGPRDEERSVTETTVAIAEENLARTIAEETEKVENARRTLLSSGLEALPADKDNSNTPPTVSGTYTCSDEGAYTLSLFRSGTRSGYSFRLSGLESGTYTAYTGSPGPLGACGLSIVFDEDETYSSKDWTVAVPNTQSASYVTNLNAYELALQQERNNVAAKEQALTLARQEQVLENASPRSEELQRTNAAVMQAAARLSVIDARIADRTLVAPFAGTVNNVDVVRGETVTAVPVVTVVADDTFALTARIPEIDITKLAVGQRAEVVFDARSSEVLDAEISFISPLATEIDGVAYFEATIRLNNPPTWLRGGLNADVDIIVDEEKEALRIPRRFLSGEAGSYSVLTLSNGTVSSTTVESGFMGNDGFVEVIGLTEGDVVVAP